MVLKNPIILITIPLALAFGLIWFRRKKVHCDSGGLKTSPNQSDTVELNKKEIQEKRIDLRHSISLPIGGTPKKLSSTPLNNNESFDFKFGKSAPIDITPHKTSPIRKNDSDTKEKIEILNSIEENSLDSVDLPGSVNCRRRFSFTIKTNEPTVVVKASTMNVEKSPQSSFETLATLSPSDKTNFETIKSTKNKKLRENKCKSEEKDNSVSEITNNQKSNNNKESKKSVRSTPLASPSLSLCSNKSLDSGDSGNGSSPPNSEGGQTLSSLNSYDFQLQQTLVGFLVGKHGSTVKKIREDCNVNIVIRRHPFNPKKFKLCTIQGTQEQIEKALAMIKNKLPPKVNLERLGMELESAEILSAISNIHSSLAQLNLIDGINNDVSVCTVINGGHLFLHQPLHPSYPSLNILQSYMSQSYSAYESPALPHYSVSAVCIGHVDGHYYRLQIIEYLPEEGACLAKYLDFGGYCKIQTTELKQIRADFLSVPFQAIECLLANIKPKGDEWSIEAAQAIVELTHFRALQAQVAGYSESGLPEINLYSCISNNHVVFINEELVARHLADWCIPASIQL